MQKTGGNLKKILDKFRNTEKIGFRKYKISVYRKIGFWSEKEFRNTEN